MYGWAFFFCGVFFDGWRLWVTRAAKDRKEEFYDPARKYNILGRNTTRLDLWEEHLKDPIVALDKALICVEDQH